MPPFQRSEVATFLKLLIAVSLIIGTRNIPQPYLSSAFDNEVPHFDRADTREPKILS
jgi:hypothetical protein